ncbi:nectin-1-like isoform X6 [Takifugu flavidus]|uniref:nectin-1-like isoform X6 n=1 Tax=Takifugu flavidus TaxID=433684 RepID=UPI002544963C|nr:nectin-1-like isoform X6 [Takifugu flavidus]
MCFYRNIFIIFAVGFLMTLAPSVVGRDVSVIQGETGVLLCNVIDTDDSVAQISWEKRTRGHPQDSEFVTIRPESGLKVINGDGDRVKFIGNIDDKNGSLELSGITLMDEGIYTCAFTLFPGGTQQQKTISLNVVVPPVSSLVDNHPVLGDKEVSLATCTAAGSKPPATVSWLFGDLPGDLTTIRNAIRHQNGTVTTVSSLVGVPSRELDQQLVQCVVTSKATKDQTLPFTIRIYFPPSEVNINEQPDGSFSCDTAAKPKPEIVWTRIDGSWPESSVTVKDGRLKFLTMDASLNGLYQCEASNEYGSKYGRLYVHNNAGHCTDCWTLFGLLISIIVVAGVIRFLCTSGKINSIPLLRHWQAVQTMASTPKRTTREVPAGIEAKKILPHIYQLKRLQKAVLTQWGIFYISSCVFLHYWLCPHSDCLPLEMDQNHRAGLLQ